MARIPETELDRLKQEIPIAALVEARGVLLHQQGADLVGCCPFHQDDTPSLHLSVEKNLWHCFGACAQGGSVLDWVMKAEGISFRHCPVHADSEAFSGDALPHSLTNRASAPSRHLNSVLD